MLCVVLVALATLVLSAAIVPALRAIVMISLSYAESLGEIDFSWKDYPFRRLLDPADFEYLRRRGVSEAKIRQVRKERRRLFRLCLRSLARDFNTAHRALAAVVVRSHVDRPDLAVELAHQRATFYRNIFKAEAWMLMDACGFDHLPAVDLLEPLKNVQAQLRELAPTHALAGSLA